MLSQVFPCPQIHPFEAATRIDDLATNAFMLAMYDDTILMGDLAYNYLALETSVASGQIFPDWHGYSPLPEYTYGSTVHLSPSNSSLGSVASPNVTDVPSFFSPSPSPSPSQASSASDHQETPREPSPIPGSGCGNATPMFNHIRGKWCCSACDKPFRGKWECRRHIGITGKRAKCVACGGKLSGREDSLRRHFTKYCKGDVANLRFENAFTEV